MQVLFLSLHSQSTSTQSNETMRDKMRSLYVLLLTLFALTTAAHPTRRHDPKPVCIIGAGPAGLSAAGRLEHKGIKAIIFDEQEEVGGKCQAFYNNE
jgi:NADPH-dependent 2,4-dienoyl-CoA reductase/sulfur reductase-like enzyme